VTRARIVAAESARYRTEFDLETYFLHDLPESVLRSGPAHQREMRASFCPTKFATHARSNGESPTTLTD